ncbi:MAG: ABC transporter substrate-binding protein [Candidatus Latescibacteria bacterium]|nr:ABC transporter substrate-binding protein [Candidatus Latescibacterota bacterium]
MKRAWPGLCLLLGLGLARAEPYREFSAAGAAFNGPGRNLEAPDTLSAVRLGLLGPAQSAAGRQLQLGVQAAVAEANAAGGYGGLPFAVVFRPDDGPWGVVASQVVRLAQEDQVWAIIGGLDGERAHAAELVAAKLWVPVLSPAAGDRTIDYANVPWMFRCLPDDRSQADSLVALCARQGWRRIGVACEANRDGHIAAERLLEAAHACSLTLTLQIEYAPADPEPAAERLASCGAQALVVWGRPATALPLLVRLRAAGCTLPVLAPALLALPEVAAQDRALGPLIVAAPADLSVAAPATLGEHPSYVALFAYDTTQLVIAALRRSGLNRARLRDALADLPFAGLTGDLSFNSLGGRRAGPVLMRARQGQWVRWQTE